jgi:hypothetical protein
MISEKLVANSSHWRLVCVAIGIGHLPEVRHLKQPSQNQRRPAPSATNAPVADPGGLVARALAILAEEGITSDQTRFLDLPAPGQAFNDENRPVDPPLQHRVLSDGTKVRLPIRYFDDTCLIATFLIDPNRAAELLLGTGLQAALQEDGKAVVALGCFEYRKTDIGPYNEVGLVVSAVAPGDPIPALYVTNLPVNTAVADRAGREIWGYNKFVAAIDIKRDRKKFSMSIRDPEALTIATLEVTRGASVPAPPTDMLTFSLLQGRVIKTLIRVLTPFQVSSGDGFVLKVGTSRHPMADNLRTLALDRARPMLLQYADPFQSLLFPGRVV